MIQSGIVRRIDHLGRVVLPREMRKTMRINDGDPLEISLENGGILLKKYSPIMNFNSIANTACLSLAESLEKNCIICDTDKIISVSHNKYRDFIEKQISKELSKVVQEKKSQVLKRGDGANILPITNEEDFSSQNQIIVPIIKNGDCYGLVIVFDSEKNSAIEIDQVKQARLCANILAHECE